jgi:arylsulfatase A-like enzyme
MVRSDRKNQRLRIALAIALAFALALFLAGRWWFAVPATARPPIVLIVVDTVRADHVGVYGAAHPTTPNIDRFAARAVRFDNAQAPSSWTVPSMASLFTGVYPWRHGVNTAESTGPTGVKGQPVLSERFVTLATALRQAGYATFGVTANGHLDPKFGLARGFETYRFFSFVKHEPVDRAFAATAPELRRALRRGQPYFLYLHYFDPHHPYLPVRPWIDQWRPDVDPERIKTLTQTEFNRLVLENYFLQHRDAMRLLADLYDSEIAAADASVGAALRALPGADRALIVITADHGESFGDHRNMLHGGDLFAETLRVPLLIRWPGATTATVVPAPVSLVDLYPTLAAAAGAAPPDYLDGVDLTGLARGEPAPSRALFAATERDPRLSWSAVLADGWKWLRNEENGDELLFHVAADAADKKNVAAAEPQRVQALRELWLGRPTPDILFPPAAGPDLDPAYREKLHSLGYL